MNPEYKLEIKNKSKDLWKDQKSKIGGNPDWIQNRQRVSCDSCKKDMQFYGQLDSISDVYKIQDSGMVYVFICHDCGKSKSIIQSY
jgi:hypothetical protein